MMIEFDEYKVKLNGLKPKLDELAASLGIERWRILSGCMHRSSLRASGTTPRFRRRS